MGGDRYRRALEAAQGEYEQLMQQRADIDRRLAHLLQTIGSISRLCNLTPSVGLGLTDACRVALKAAGRPLTAPEMRQRLEAMGFDTSRYANPLAAIHTVLRRLDQGGLAELSSRAFKQPVIESRTTERVRAKRTRNLPAARPARGSGKRR